MTAVPIVVGLVNGMPGEAFGHTERQFRAILAEAGGEQVELRLYSLDGARPQCHDITALRVAPPDELIVTGMPPRAAALTDEPYWHTLTALVDFAAGRAVPTVWSCLAAHAAVLYLDGIERRRLPEKLSGLVECTRTDAGHPAMDGLPWRWQMPHSRYNDLPEATLRARGYRILSRSAAAGADIFAKTVGAPFLFCQGHPEYDAHTLLLEYRRDIRQFLAGERDAYPAAPQNYFSPNVLALLAAFRDRSLRERRIETFEAFPMAACAADVSHGWYDLAVSLYANWLAGVVTRMGRYPEAGEIEPARIAEHRAETKAVPTFGAEAR